MKPPEYWTDVRWHGKVQTRDQALALVKEIQADAQAAEPSVEDMLRNVDTATDTASYGAYDDRTIMNFGKYKGIALEHIPASYLHWLWTQRPMFDKKLENYIRENIPTLKTEYPDGIWT